MDDMTKLWQYITCSTIQNAGKLWFDLSAKIKCPISYLVRVTASVIPLNPEISQKTILVPMLYVLYNM